MKTTNFLLLGSLLLATASVACGDDNTGTGGGGGDDTATSSTTTAATTTTATTTVSSSSGGEGGDTPGTGGGGSDPGTGGAGGEGGSGPPAAPELGEQVDRMGRPAINTALNDTFVRIDDQGDLAPSDDDLRIAAEDAYNAAVTEEEWESYIPTMALQLGVLDGLDETCSNQPASCADPANPPAAEDGGCYGTLASVLANDVLWVSTVAETCGAYLGQELAFLGVDIDDCGGRRPIDDVIATTYTATTGLFPTPGFDDGITVPAVTSDAAAAFPYMGAPVD